MADITLTPAVDGINERSEGPWAPRVQRENELKGMLANHLGRNQLTQLLRQYLNVPFGQLPAGTPFVETILAYEFIDPPALPIA